jgi:hypothetical protein
MGDGNGYFENLDSIMARSHSQSPRQFVGGFAGPVRDKLKIKLSGPIK